ncbi:MAG TPA: SGNH/GDSL hydrolase family protein [Armatimonadota bacterium]|jgi:lysophospholipase L1-like esterase
MAQDFVWQDGERVMFIGDSLTEDPDGYTRLVPLLVTARYPERAIDYRPRGVGGNRIGDLLERINRDVFDNDPPPSWIGVSIGLNDVQHESSGTPPGRFRDSYEALLLRLEETKAKIMCFTTTVLSEELDNAQNAALEPYNTAIRDLAFAHGADVADMHTAFQEAIRNAQAHNPGIRFTTDGEHLTDYGRYLMSLVLLRALHLSP